MKKYYVGLLLASLVGCSDNIESGEAKAVTSPQTETATTEAEAFIESMGDSILPYFEFNNDGSRIEDLPNPSILAKSVEKKKHLYLILLKSTTHWKTNMQNESTQIMNILVL